MLLIPTPTDGYPDWTARVSLDGSTYDIRWQWNERDGAWVFSIADRDGPLLSGVRVALNVDLLARCPMSSRRPPGPIYVVDPSKGRDEPTQSDLGQRVKVVYVPEAEL
jgi:hypothetical protein